jgi:hypothetical protein
MADEKFGEKNSLKTFDEQGNELAPTPKKIALHKASNIRREMGCIYREMRSGKIEAQDGTRLVYVLDMMRKAFDTELLENRLEDVKQLLNRRDT